MVYHFEQEFFTVYTVQYIYIHVFFFKKYFHNINSRWHCSTVRLLVPIVTQCKKRGKNILVRPICFTLVNKTILRMNAVRSDFTIKISHFLLLISKRGSCTDNK
jgi:hypothetical protein